MLFVLGIGFKGGGKDMTGEFKGWDYTFVPSSEPMEITIQKSKHEEKIVINNRLANWLEKKNIDEIIVVLGKLLKEVMK